MQSVSGSVAKELQRLRGWLRGATTNIMDIVPRRADFVKSIRLIENAKAAFCLPEQGAERTQSGVNRRKEKTP